MQCGECQCYVSSSCRAAKFKEAWEPDKLLRQWLSQTVLNLCIFFDRRRKDGRLMLCEKPGLRPSTNITPGGFG